MSLELLHAAVAGRPTTREQARDLLQAYADGQATPEQLAATLTALNIRGENADVLTGFAEVLRAHLIAVDAQGLDAVDLCGTGGDGQHTVNLSTTAAFVVAGAGVPVAKHGNHGVSSRTGSADVLQALGIRLSGDVARAERHLRDLGLAFLHAPAHHPLFAKIGPVRRALGFRTAFNLLGPVCNPARVQRQMLGTATPEAQAALAEVLCRLGTVHAMVVHTPGPYDEVSLTAPVRVLEVRNGALRAFHLAPSDFDTVGVAPADLVGGDAMENAARIEALLAGERSPLRRAVCANAACTLVVAGRAQDVAEGFRLAEVALDSGAALALLEAHRKEVA